MQLKETYQEYYDKIASVVDNSGNGISRILITFKNGKQLSIIRGWLSYGYKQGLFEVMTDSEVTKTEDGVLGFLTITDLNRIIKEVADL